MTIWYTKTHQWYNDENGEVGLTPFAAEELGEIAFVDVKELEGAELTQVTMDDDGPTSHPIDAMVESSKAVGDLYSPVSGTVKEINKDLVDEPEKINNDAFSAWLYKIDASNWDAEKGNLLDEAAYKAFTYLFRKFFL